MVVKTAIRSLIIVLFAMFIAVALSYGAMAQISSLSESERLELFNTMKAREWERASEWERWWWRSGKFIVGTSVALVAGGFVIYALYNPTGTGGQGNGKNQNREGNRQRGKKREGNRQHSAKPRGKPEYNYYDILGVGKTADLATIKSAHRKMAMKFHPDNVENNAWAKSRFIEIQEAYEVLRDSKKRADYDRSLG